MNRLSLKVFTSSDGFTLIETIIALVILVIGVLGVFSMQLQTIKGNANAMSLSRSVQETSAALDRAESLTYDDNGLDEAASQGIDTLFGETQNFSGTITYVVDEYAASSGAESVQSLFNLTNDTFAGSKCKQITVNSTQTSSGRNQTVSLQYIKVDY